MKKVINNIFRAKIFWISLAIAVLCIGLSFLKTHFLLDILELKSIDLRFIVRGPEEPSGNVVIAYIDERSIREIGHWPWPRDILADIAKKINENGAKTIGFDILLIEPEKSCEFEKLQELLNNYVTLGLLTDDANSQAYMDELAEAVETANNDERLATVIGQRHNVVLGMAFLNSNDADHRKELPYYFIRSAYAAYENRREMDAFTPPFFNDFSLPVPMIAEAAANIGYVNAFVNKDGALRREAMAIYHQEALYAPFSLRVAQNYLDIPDSKIVFYFNEKIDFDNRTIPIDSKGFTWINFYGPSFTIPSFSVIDILDGSIEAKDLKDKVVVIGGAATGIADLWPNPFTPTFPGVEKQATVIDNIIRNNFIRYPENEKTIMALTMVFIGLIMGVTLHRVKPLTGICFSVFLVVIYYIVIQYVFSRHRFILNFTFPFCQIVLTGFVISAYRFFIEEQDKKFLRNTFSNYLATEVIEEMCHDRRMPKLGGETKTITSLFTDIQDFSVFSEMLTAEQLIELLNEYLTAMTAIVIEEKGCLDKYVGDAIIAFFGAPLDINDHTVRALRVGLRMQQKLRDLCDKWQNEIQGAKEADRNRKQATPEEWAPGDKWPKLVHQMRMRIGINTGNIVVGNIGSAMRKNYTMIGDAVNLSARLESAAKYYGIYTLASENTLNRKFPDKNGQSVRAADFFDTRLIDKVIVVGRSFPVKIYEVLAYKNESGDKQKKLVEIFESGVEWYLQRRWDEALEIFRQSAELEIYPDAPVNPSKVYIERCISFKKNPPVEIDEEWNGVFNLTKK